VNRDVVILACAISAGVHGALMPVHFGEGLGPGVGFAAATVLLGAVAAAMTMRPASDYALVAAAVVLGGLLVSYALAATVGLPLVHPSPEPVDGLALATKAVEAVGLLAAASVFGDGEDRKTVPLPLPALIAVFSALVALAVTTGHGAHT
jgi:hypothetical protein